MNFKLEKRDFLFNVYPAKKIMVYPHVHSHIEITFIEKDGKSRGFSDDKTVLIEENDIFITFPNQVHHYEDIVTPMKAYVLMASPEMCPEFETIFKSQIPESPILKNAGNNPLILSSFKILYDCSQNKGKYSDTLSRGALLVLLSEIFKGIKLSKIPGKDANILKSVIDYCYENYTNDISLQSISYALNIDRYYISRIFSQQLHIGFFEYINSLRIMKASELLKTKKLSITEIAFAVGYNSVRSFNRCFRKIHNTSPKEYRLNFLEKATTPKIQ